MAVIIVSGITGYIEEHSSMVYSEVVDGIFCIYCTLFCLKTSRDSFVAQPFHLWNKKGEKAKKHEKCAYHKCAVDKAASFRPSIENSPSLYIINGLCRFREKCERRVSEA